MGGLNLGVRGDLLRPQLSHPQETRVSPLLSKAQGQASQRVSRGRGIMLPLPSGSCERTPAMAASEKPLDCEVRGLGLRV